MTNTFDKAIAKRSMLQNRFNKNRSFEKWYYYKAHRILCSIEHEKNLAKKTFFGKQ